MIAIKGKENGDDLFVNRLFSYLKKELTIPIVQLSQIKEDVFFLSSEQENYILKGFTDLKKMKIQEAFLASLKKEGFTHAFTFFDFSFDPPLYFEKKYYGLLEYIPHARTPLDFGEAKDRRDALLLLSQYHVVTAKLVPTYIHILKEYDLIQKWRNRTVEFINHLSIVKYFVQTEILTEMLNWADWSLKGIEQEQAYFRHGKKVVLHGDLANHNFIRDTQSTIHLIDYDLISIGSPACDLLQYCQRILPHIHWSYSELEHVLASSLLLQEKACLFALVFPSDVFREWNRLIRNGLYRDPTYVRPVLDLTARQYHERLQFVHFIKKLV